MRGSDVFLLGELPDFPFASMSSGECYGAPNTRYQCCRFEKARSIMRQFVAARTQLVPGRRT